MGRMAVLRPFPRTAGATLLVVLAVLVLRETRGATNVVDLAAVQATSQVAKENHLTQNSLEEDADEIRETEELLLAADEGQEEGTQAMQDPDGAPTDKVLSRDEMIAECILSENGLEQAKSHCENQRTQEQCSGKMRDWYCAINEKFICAEKFENETTCLKIV